MRCRLRRLVSAFLPLVPLAFCNGCGGGGDGTPAAAAAPPSAVAPTAPAVVNAPPTIRFEEAIEAGKVGEAFDLQPVVADAEDDALQFAAANLPAWASLDPTSGRISGTPGVNDVGVYESITVSVADATHTVATAPFSITVIQNPDVGTGVASLQWQQPTSKVSGEPLDDLAGYRILYGRDSADLDRSVLVADPTMTSYQFSTLPSGTWYFAVVAVSSCGLEGPPTTIATKSI